MQPKFTQRKLWSFCAKTLALFFVFAIYAQVGSAQESNRLTPGAKQNAKGLSDAKRALINAQRLPVNPKSDNDAGVPNRKSTGTGRNGVSAVCATFTGSLGAPDPTMSGRLNRNGIQGVCPGPKPFAGTLAANTFFDTHTWTNTSGLAQCATFSLSTTDATTNIEFGVYVNSFDPNNLATNFLTDPGLSSGTPPTVTTCSANVAAGQTLVFVVFSPNALQTAANYTLTVDLPICSSVPCSGTPSPGNTLASSTLVCPSANFTLSLQNSTPGSGVTYQWQRSATLTGTYTSIPGATNPTYTGTQSAATYYRCQVTCSGNTGTSNPIQVTMDNIDNCYCVPVYTNGCSFGDYIARVQFGTLNNVTTCSAPPYTFYNAVPAPVLIQGATYPLSITVGPDTFGQRCAAWIDYNRDGDFDDAGEFLGNTGDAGPGGTVTINVTIPAGTNIGTTRLRVRGGDDNPTSPGSTQACGATAGTFGEAEDYNVNIQPCVAFTNVTGPNSATVQCSANASFSINIGSASLPVIGWEYRTSAAGIWQNVINGVGPAGVVFSGATTNAITLTGVPSTLSGYQFRAYYSNPCTAIDFTAPATLTVVPLVATVNPTSATICRGTILPLTLTNATSPTTAVFNASAGLPAAVPDNTPNGINRTVTVSGIPSNAVITEVRLTFTMTHTYSGDLVMNLGNPTGDVINLVGLIDGGTGSNSTPNFTNTVFSSDNSRPAISGAPAPRTGIFRADRYNTVGVGPNNLPTNTGSWAGFQNPANVNGTWTLGMCDLGPGDLGNLISWSVTIIYGAPAAGVWSSNPATPNTMWLDAGATTPYAGDARTTIYVNPTANTNYSVVYTTAAPSCVSPATVIPVTVLQPLGTVVQPTDKSVCVGGTTSFTVTAPGGPWTYQWQESRNNGLTWANVGNGGVYSGATTNTLTLTGVTRSAPVDMNNFLYRVGVTTSPCSGSFTSSVVKLTVNALPTVTIAATDLALLPNQTSTITASSSPAPNATPNWAWTRDGSPIVGSTNSVVADIDRLGVYQATVTDVNGCRNSSNQLLIEAEAGEKLWLYPNPTSGQFQIRLYYPGVTSEKRRIQIFNSAGSEVMSRDIMLSNVTSPHYQRFDIDLSFQPAGIYLVKVIDMYTKKAVSGFVIKQAK